MKDKDSIRCRVFLDMMTYDRDDEVAEFHCRRLPGKKSDNTLITYSKHIKTFLANVVGCREKCGKRQHFYKLSEDIDTARLDTFPKSTVFRSER